MSILQFHPKETFFKSVKFNDYLPGQFCRTVVPNLEIIPKILDVERNKPESHDEIRFELRDANLESDFRMDRVLPIKKLQLRSNEELLVQPAKRRPGIIIAAGADEYEDITKILKQKAKKHLQDDPVFVIPCYSIETKDDHKGFIQQMIPRIQCLMYRQYFYFPSSEKFKEGIARFDRIQVIRRQHINAIQPMNICLSDDVVGLFIELFMFCITGVESQELAAIRELAMEAYSPE